MFFDSTFIILIPALIIAAFAQMKVSSAYNKYSKINNMRGITGADTARHILDANGLFDVPIEIIPGKLTDHYDPKAKVMRLSNDVYRGTSIAAVGVAAHESGHALQDQQNYAPIKIRNSIFPVVNFSSQFSWIIFFVGLIFGFSPLINIGILLFTAVVAFQIITLPVEFNASNRAIAILEERGILYGDELSGAKAVLSAAAMTYVAAALMATAQLLRLLALSNRRR